MPDVKLTEAYITNLDSAVKFADKKSNEIYYNDPICKNGYFRGEETYSFVRNVMQRFEYYKKSLPE